ncbi:MAG: 5'/3'-nucleotidase SurE [gamma proteobacterium symbiont of Bathyaustriella thionipta]|nr:5'/3'-nucleotidase SurE [gamma proteobacterium symbiont of Bathyaustriella thionipta]MCU7951000.1 5'/3'-nucleotidase SurE [gamma proteobacterium symbiont of Bathyaustriella thionipta]MCU7951841.1 5'/3'-nucleotidase SurE [gamma proteobacterium symbiont of Bathyaustriella thionipta]MCU7957507.1 5'/3'-nucleotidase SurE [gamma proteobacterium symbiont of Bathyaustriella thionipta]MCU7968205.1 5'/3'-nucleotidase SurE [gamma proteobacterium symbiont of Bathyaustriella thionipta]
MHILVSNDDGYLAEGLNCLVEHLSQIARVTVVAPQTDRSGASNSLTLDRPLLPETADNGFIAINGTPTDCVHIAITALLKNDPPDIIVSGINRGPNMGDDILYSGTVAAATEGRFLGLPAIAVSLGSFEGRYFSTAAQVIVNIIQKLQIDPLASDTILNINVPDVEYNHLKSFEITRLGKRHKAEPAVEAIDPRNRKVYWLGPVGDEADAGPGTDFYALSQNQVSITPITIDLTNHVLLKPLRQWLKTL